MHRRTFLTAMGALAGLGRVPALAAADPLLKRVGLQLYTVRDLMQQDMERTLERVAAIGYQEVEFAGYFGRPATEIRAMLDRFGLKAPAAHVDPKILTGDWDRIFADAKVIGHDYVIVAWTPELERRTLDDYHKLAARFNRAAIAARHEGLTFAYHNHDYEFVPIDRKVPYEILLDETDRRTVKFELDLFWARKAGLDPRGLFARFPKRFRCAHVKDMTADGRMVDVGAGDTDWRPLLEACRDAGIEHFFVEHDEPADSIWSATASYRYLTQKS